MIQPDEYDDTEISVDSVRHKERREDGEPGGGAGDQVLNLTHNKNREHGQTNTN